MGDQKECAGGRFILYPAKFVGDSIAVDTSSPLLFDWQRLRQKFQQAVMGDPIQEGAVVGWKQTPDGDVPFYAWDGGWYDKIAKTWKDAKLLSLFVVAKAVQEWE